MNVINFPGSRGRRGDKDAIERAIQLKQRLIDFVLKGPVREAFDEQWELDGIDSENPSDAIDFVDWFIFDWRNEEGLGVVEQFIEATPELDGTDRVMAESWIEAIDDLFRVQGIFPDGFELTDGEGNVYFTAPTNASTDELGWTPGMVVGSRILPVRDFYILSGAQTFYTDEPDAETGDAETDAGVHLVRALYDAFVAHFGSDEVDTTLGKLEQSMNGYRDFVMNVYVPPDLEQPLGTIMDDGGNVTIPDLEVPPEVLAQHADAAATLLADPNSGLALVPGYGAVRDHLQSGEGDPKDLLETVAMLLGEPNVPAFVVRRLAAIHGERFGRLVGSVVRDDSFDVETDLDDLIEELKPDDYSTDQAEMDDEVITPDDLEDVRDLPVELLVEGSVAANAVAFLADTTFDRLGRTTDELARGLSLLVYYGDIYAAGRMSDLDAQTLLDFLTAWYPRAWSERGQDDARSLLATLDLFSTWLLLMGDRQLADVARRDVFPVVEHDLPRTVEAAVVLDSALPATDLAEIVDDAADDAEDAIEGLFEIAMIDFDETILTLIERFEGDEQVAVPTPSYEIEVPLAATALVECGDLIEGTLVQQGGIWRLHDLVAVYCPAADV
ncbi:MAG TPA: hypothetical protein PLF26_06450 [Blastocatellia bacterium]|nr:hypothetical protein [Blastocatellia bacterium]